MTATGPCGPQGYTGFPSFVGSGSLYGSYSNTSTVTTVGTYWSRAHIEELLNGCSNDQEIRIMIKSFIKLNQTRHLKKIITDQYPQFVDTLEKLMLLK